MYKRSSLFSWRRHTTVILSLGFAMVLVAVVVAYTLEHFKPTTQVFIGMGGVYNLHVANTEAKRSKGLSGVEKLSPNGGLLMVYPEDGAHKIWMKDMRIPIDVVWLDKDKKVVYLKQSLSPNIDQTKVYGPLEPTVRYILELPEGAISGSAIRKGSTALFDVEEAKK